MTGAVMLTGQTEILGHKPPPETRDQPQIPHVKAWDGTRCLQQEAGIYACHGKRSNYSAIIHVIGTGQFSISL